jgi:hypothetical protein
MTDPEVTPVSPEVEGVETEDAETVETWLKQYAESVDRLQQLEHWLEMDPQYKELQAERARISELEDKIKAEMKEHAGWCTKVENAGYEAIVVIRHGKPTIEYNIKAIEEEPWGPGCVVKAVDVKVFDLIIKGKGLEPEDYYLHVEPGTESKAVTIRKVEDKKP